MSRYSIGDSLTLRLQRRVAGAVCGRWFLVPFGGLFLRLLLLASLQLLCPALCAQSIVTVAGGGTDDGRPATVASLYGPDSVALDASGSLYITDYFNHRIRRVDAQSGIISTVAGNGSRGFSGDGGAATAAGLSYPSGVALDAAGNLYVADRFNNRIRKVAAGSGIISTVAGGGTALPGDGGPATAARIVGPRAVTVDIAGNLYIADSFNHRIRKVDVGNRIITTVAGNGTQGFSGDGGPATAASLYSPRGITVDPSGNLYVADVGNHRVRRVAVESGIILTVTGNGTRGFSGDGGPATEASLAAPQGLTRDAIGNLYVADTGNQRIRRIAASTGIISTVVGSGTKGFSGDGAPATSAALREPFGLVVDGFGNLYVTDTNNQRVRKVSADTGLITTIAGNGFYGYSGDGGPATNTVLSYPFGVCSDAAGNLYIADAGSDRVFKVSAESGILSTVVGNNSRGEFYGDGGPATEAGLHNPDGLTLDSLGNLYVADTYHHRVRKVAADTGIITTIAGNGTLASDGISGSFSGDGGPATAAALNFPTTIAVDPTGNLFIADAENHRLRKVAAGSGIITTVAGNGMRGYSGDGGPATAATLDTVSGVALDALGNLYVADSYNNRVRKIAAGSGTISTVAGKGPEGDSSGTSSGDGGSAIAAGLSRPSGISFDGSGNLYITEDIGNRVRRVAAASGLISTIAGNGRFSSAGDGGRATAAGLNNPFGIYADSAGNVYIGSSGRVRAVFACVTVNPAELSSPANGSSGVATAPRLAWEAVHGAFRYDILLDTVNPPAKTAVQDVTTLSFSPANLDPLSTYYWQVIAKGDPFCSPPSKAASEIRSFTTAGGCRGPGGLEGQGP